MSQNRVASDQAQYHFIFLVSAQEIQIENKNSSSLLLNKPDSKVLYMTARPGRDRAFISIDRFLTAWVENSSFFSLNPPRIALIYSAMHVNQERIGHAIPLFLDNPQKESNQLWRFLLKVDEKMLPKGRYQGVTFFIDWPASPKCPEPIQLLLPSLFKETE